MTSLSADVLAHHLRRLGPAARRRFVADLWRARGYEVRRAAGTILATDGPRSVRVQVGAGSADPDVLVDFDGSAATPTDVTVLDTADLVEVLEYAIEPDAARELCETHLGAPPGALPPPRTARLRRRVRSARPALPALLVVGVLVALLGAIALGGAPASPAQSPPATPAEEVARTGAVVPPPSYPTPPPGGFLNTSLLDGSEADEAGPDRALELGRSDL